VDIEPPDSSYIAKRVPIPTSAWRIDVSNGYAFIADWDAGLLIMDIEPPESAFIASITDTPGYASGVNISDNIAYVADLNGGLRIIQLW
jgi:hypothetical protein